MKEKFYGVYAALLTPFNEKGEVCEKRLRKLVKFLIFIKKLHHQFLFLSFSIT
jgi:dihydrodipicolinate synthase/N-acetylneuraminate lyase